MISRNYLVSSACGRHFFPKCDALYIFPSVLSRFFVICLWKTFIPIENSGNILNNNNNNK